MSPFKSEGLCTNRHLAFGMSCRIRTRLWKNSDATPLAAQLQSRTVSDPEYIHNVPLSFVLCCSSFCLLCLVAARAAGAVLFRADHVHSGCSRRCCYIAIASAMPDAGDPYLCRVLSQRGIEMSIALAPYWLKLTCLLSSDFR